MKRFADIVEEVKSLSTAEKNELSIILDHILIDERRESILKNHHESMEEYKSSKLKFYDNPEDIISSLNED